MVEKSLYDYDKHQQIKAQNNEGKWRDGFCAICSTDKAPHLCVKCGSMVCSEHYVSIMGLCVDCAPVKDTGKAFKMSEPLHSPGSPLVIEPTIQDAAKVVTFREDAPPTNILVVHKGKKQDESCKPKQDEADEEEKEIEWV